MLKRLSRPLTLALLLSGVLPAHAGEMLADARVIRSVSHGQPFAREMNAVGRLVGIDPALLRAVVVQESSGNLNAVSEAGAVGLTQLMPVAIRQYTREAAQLLGRAMRSGGRTATWRPRRGSTTAARTSRCTARARWRTARPSHGAIGR